MPEQAKLIAAACLVAFALVLPNWRRVRRIVRTLICQTGCALREARPGLPAILPGRTVSNLHVVDGDTVDDPVTGIRYRLANIDCPETDERAKCYRERIRGEQAKGAAEMIFVAARDIELRPTGKTDRYGRTVAFIPVDGQDYGDLMIEKGFAQPWDGQARTLVRPERRA